MSGKTRSGGGRTHRVTDAGDVADGGSPPVHEEREEADPEDAAEEGPGEERAPLLSTSNGSVVTCENRAVMVIMPWFVSEQTGKPRYPRNLRQF